MAHTVNIIKLATDEVVKTIDVTDRAPRQIEKLINGMSINLNHADYAIVELGKGDDSEATR